MQLSRAFRNAGRFTASLVFFVALALVPVASASAAGSTIGEHKTAVILVNFTDNTAQPRTAVEANALVFDQVSDFLWEASYQRTFLSGETFGWFTISASATLCDTATIVAEGNKAATAAGANLAAYTQFIYMFPYRSGCSWSGTGAVGPAGEKIIYINGSGGMGLQTIAHELGHRFGLGHSDGLDCDLSPLGNTCTQQGYADPTDTMGNRAAHFNTFQKERLGWLGAVGAPSITTVASSGRYVIEPYETFSQGAKALKILKSTDPNTGQKTWYYIEYRQPIGFDSVLAGRGTITSGLMVHTGTVTSNGNGTSLVLDMTPNTITTSKSADFEDGVIAVGTSYTDATAGVTIALVSADANGAVIDVSMGTAPPATCTRAAPIMSLSGPTAAVAAGSTVSYTLSITNKDSSACSASSFNLARSVPTGWSSSLTTSSVTLSPGASANASLSVTSASNAASGAYGIGVGSSSGAGSVHSANAAATYSVSAPATTTLTETVGTDKTSYLRAETVYMSARVLGNGAPVSGASVRFTVTLPNGSSSVLNATSGIDGYGRATLKLGKTKAAIGGYQLRADASSGSASASASSGFSVR